MGRHNKRVSKKVSIAVAATILIFLTVIYLSFTVYFESHFFFNTTINGEDVSGRSVKSVEELFKNEIRFYALSIEKRDQKTENISSSDIKMNHSFITDLKKLKKEQGSFSWFFSNNLELSADFSITYNEEKLNNTINSLECTNKNNFKAPTKDTLVFENNSYSIKKGDPGTILDIDKFKKIVKYAIDNRIEKINLDDEGCYVNEYVKDEDLYKVKEKLNLYISSDIIINIGENKEVLDSNILKDFISVDDEYNILIDKKLIKDHISKLSKDYNTINIKREFKPFYTSNKITLLTGDFGYEIDIEKEVENIYKAIVDGVSKEHDVIFKESKMTLDYDKTTSTNLFTNDSFIEINIIKQEIIYHRSDKTNINYPIITGKPYETTKTPIGVYYVKTKSYDKDKDIYKLEFIKVDDTNSLYIMNDNERSFFGENIYLINGSNGDVLLNKSNMQSLYNSVNVGIPVVIYEYK